MGKLNIDSNLSKDDSIQNRNKEETKKKLA